MAKKTTSKDQQQQGVCVGSLVKVNRSWYRVLSIENETELNVVTRSGKTKKTVLKTTVKYHIKPLF